MVAGAAWLLPTSITPALAGSVNRPCESGGSNLAVETLGLESPKHLVGTLEAQRLDLESRSPELAGSVDRPCKSWGSSPEVDSSDGDSSKVASPGAPAPSKAELARTVSARKRSGEATRAEGKRSTKVIFRRSLTLLLPISPIIWSRDQLMI